MKTRLIVIALAIFILNGCKNGKLNIEFFPDKSEEPQEYDSTKVFIKKEYHKDGYLEKEISILGTKRHGPSITYYYDGIKFTEIPYDLNRKHGVAKKYYRDGKLYRETPYEYGFKHGVQKKYFEEGDIMSEMPYFKDCPGIGLKEYSNTTRKLITQYPEILVKHIDQIETEHKYTIEIRLSENSEKAELYRGNLYQDKYLLNDQIARLVFSEKVEIPQPLEIDNGVAYITYHVPKGFYVMEQINIILKVPTKYGNYYITQKKINVAFQN